MQIVLTSLHKIRAYPKNAKKHPARQVEQVAASIKEFGFNQPIVVDQEGVIVVGHGRFEAAKLLGLEDVPVLVADLTEEQAKAYRLADNKLNESDWDMGLVLEELKGLSTEMLDLTGFDKDLIVTPDEMDDEVPPIPEEPQTKLGDLYELGPHRVLCGDSTLIDNMERLMGDRKADLLLTDPPYNVDYTGKTKEALQIQNDKKDETAFIQFLTDAFIAADAFMKAGAVFYIWHADVQGYSFRAAARAIGWAVRQCLVWNKNAMVIGRQDYHWKHEPCLYGWKEGASHLWASDRTQTTVLNFDRPTKSKEHPTMKPVELLAYQITNNTKGEDIVLDPFLGSGSTLIAATKLGRTCYGMELDPKYVDVIVRRYVEYTGVETVLRNGEPVEWKYDRKET